MEHADALRHLRTLIHIASETDNMDEVQAILREMMGVISNATPPPGTKPALASSDGINVPKPK